MPLSIDLRTITENVFHETGGKIYLGGEEINETMREMLKDQAEYILRSDLWEIFNATIINEAANMALIQSQDWQHVETAKMLHHWIHVFRNIVTKLAK